ncbi:DUF4364 family protein [Stygiolobus caldivivus]|uniref:ArnR1-like winged helix-turn-helix domain-containing protein n=1 Tax=Stygiolobus caldivivus TaxID=2824673 RepID=A0A8D5ZKB1_9CREN|nr:DUF4364 family protein [Stygiolobus caldivivus]BCU71072.1 hypothetical protein KN1_23690 [Stygiolobus caldivivus]
MTKKRSTAEIIYSILNACRERTNKTKIMYASALNFAELKKYLDILVKSGYLKEENEGKNSYYVISESGNRLLQILEKYVHLLHEKEELESQLGDVLSKFRE